MQHMLSFVCQCPILCDLKAMQSLLCDSITDFLAFKGSFLAFLQSMHVRCVTHAGFCLSLLKS